MSITIERQEGQFSWEYSVLQDGEEIVQFEIEERGGNTVELSWFEKVGPVEMTPSLVRLILRRIKGDFPGRFISFWRLHRRQDLSTDASSSVYRPTESGARKLSSGPKTGQYIDPGTGEPFYE